MITGAKLLPCLFRRQYSLSLRCLGQRRVDPIYLKVPKKDATKDHDNTTLSILKSMVVRSKIFHIQDTMLSIAPIWIFVAMKAPLGSILTMWTLQPILAFTMLKCIRLIMDDIILAISNIEQKTTSDPSSKMSFKELGINIAILLGCTRNLLSITDSLMQSNQVSGVIPALISLYLIYVVYSRTQASDPYLIKFALYFSLILIPATSIRIINMDMSLIYLFTMYVSNMILSTIPYTGEKTVAESVTAPVLNIRIVRLLYAAFVTSSFLFGLFDGHGVYYFGSAFLASLSLAGRFVSPEFLPKDILKVKTGLIVILLITAGIICERVQKYNKRQKFIYDMDEN